MQAIPAEEVIASLEDVVSLEGFEVLGAPAALGALAALAALGALGALAAVVAAAPGLAVAAVAGLAVAVVPPTPKYQELFLYTNYGNKFHVQMQYHNDSKSGYRIQE